MSCERDDRWPSSCLRRVAGCSSEDRNFLSLSPDSLFFWGLEKPEKLLNLFSDECILLSEMGTVNFS